jgi:predicted metal-dependent hydrolase
MTGVEIRARRVPLEFDGDGAGRHFVGGDILQSHLAMLGSSVFPEGEDFFVRSVRRYRDAITDPVLRHQVAGFIGQEAMHGREHRNFNESLARLGYPTRFFDRFTRSYLRICERVLPGPVQLAITAALEHYTATLAWVVLTDPAAREAFVDDEVRHLFVWHALEETEHKAVAFDVFQAVSGSHRIRRRVMRFVTLDLALGIVAGLLISLATDPAARRPRRLQASIRGLRRSPFARRDVLERLRDYNRPDFHPNDHDTSALAAEWQQRLFGEGAPLAARVRVSSPARPPAT